jgi:AmiR/NasT family two-component response regulator
VDEKKLQEQIDELRARMDAADVSARTHRDDTDANHTAIGDLQMAGAVDRSDIDRLQAGAEVDRHMIAELQADGVLRAEHAAQMEDALKSARVIGCAVGIVMAAIRCSQEEAFAVLVKLSQDSNRKLRLVAEDVVLTGALP